MYDNLEQRLKATILAAPNIVEPSVEVTQDGPRLVVSVVSSSFEDMDEAERQALIWDVFEESLSAEEHNRIEFVFYGQSSRTSGIGWVRPAPAQSQPADLKRWVRRTRILKRRETCPS